MKALNQAAASVLAAALLVSLPAQAAEEGSTSLAANVLSAAQESVGTASIIPEPSALAMLILGVVPMFLLLRRAGR